MTSKASGVRGLVREFTAACAIAAAQPGTVATAASQRRGTLSFMSDNVSVAGLAHVGIRVHELERSARFYALLGFEKIAGPVGPEPVAILVHPAARVEINLVLNAPAADEPNVLMDVPVKHPGITHVALSCTDVAAAKRALEAAGFPITEGPVKFGNGSTAIFVRDPDGTVIELNQPPSR